MARPSWIDDEIADPPKEPQRPREHPETSATVESGIVTDPTHQDGPGTSSTSNAPSTPSTASNPTPQKNLWPTDKIWGDRSEWKSRVVEILDQETNLPTGRVQEIFLRVSECPADMTIEDWIADLDQISSLVK